VPLHLWFEASGSKDNARVVQRAAATEDEFAPVRVDGGDLALPVAVQIEEGGVDAPAPGLGVEDGRSKRRPRRGLVQKAADGRSSWRGPRNSHKANVRLAVGAIVSNVEVLRPDRYRLSTTFSAPVSPGRENTSYACMNSPSAK